jgi:membrane-anchored protein YejM (alkaline phosphatase superfamily)
MTERISRRMLFRWTGWFAIANAVVLAVIGLGYLGGYATGGEPLAWVYLVTIYISHHVWMALLPLLLLFPLIAVWPSRRWLHTLAVVLMASSIALVLLDSLLWSQSRFHINALTVKILGMQSWVFVGMMLLIGLFFESLLAGRIWAWIQKPGKRHGKMIGWICAFCFLVAQLIYAWSDASYFVPVTRLAQQLPVYSGFTAKSFLSNNGFVDIRQSRERRLAERLSSDLDQAAGSGLRYPLNPLVCSNPEPLNLLVILVDAMRSDLLNERTAPRLTAYGNSQASRFEQHFSGGNSSRMGAFSFFYGLPPGYFSAFEAVQRSPVLIDQLQHQGYQLGLYTSARLSGPVSLAGRVFSIVKNVVISTEP